MATRSLRAGAILAGVVPCAVVSRAAVAAVLIAFLNDPRAAEAQQAPPAFAADVAPILHTHCVSCHRPGGDAPFSLVAYDEARRRASTIAAVTRKRFMPPWKPVAGVGDFVGARGLTDAQIATLSAWADAGAPEGPRGPLPSPPTTPAGWLHGTPDVVVTLAPYTVPADGPDVFRNFVVTVPGTGRRYVRGWQFRPMSRAVHHANIRVDATPASRRLDEADPDGGYEGLVLRSADFPGGQFLGWTPGQAPPPADGDLSWPLEGGTDLVVQMHLRPTGKPERVAAQIGLYVTDTPPARTPTMLRLGKQDLDIPAGAAGHEVTDSFTLPVDVDLHGVQPHAHYRARSVSALARLPNGRERPLLRIDDWDVNWQDQYRYRTPVSLPAGTTLAVTYRFDNSPGNPRNPITPPLRATWGWRSVDEMGDVWFQVIARSPRERARLQAAADRTMLAEDVVGGERVLTREPAHVALHNDTALAYLALGRPADALRHYEAVSGLTGTAAASYNEGVALETLDRLDEATARYEAAIAREPRYADAHNNLGAMLVRRGRPADARIHFDAAITADPSHASAHANLALVLAGLREPDAALAALDRALTLDPPRLARMTPLVWLLVAPADARVRRPEAGRRLAERIVAATARTDADALDALAAALASTGAFDAAIAAATDALTLAGNGDAAKAADINTRLALYRQRRPFTMP